MSLRAVANFRSSIILGQSGVPSAVTGTALETTLAKITVPGNLVGINGSLFVYTTWTITNSANNKVLRVRLGGAQINGFTLTTNNTFQHVAIIRNRGAVNSQVAFGNTGGAFSTSNTAVGTFAVDLSISQDITITGTLVTTSETIQLEGYTIEVMNP